MFRTSVTHEGSGGCVTRRSAKNIFFSEDIKKLVQRWKKCIEKQGLYVEKWCYYKFSIFIEIKFLSVLRIIIDSHTYATKIQQLAVFITPSRTHVHFSIYFNVKLKFGAHLAELLKVLYLFIYVPSTSNLRH